MCDLVSVVEETLLHFASLENMFLACDSQSKTGKNTQLVISCKSVKSAVLRPPFYEPPQIMLLIENDPVYELGSTALQLLEFDMKTSCESYNEPSITIQ